LGCPLLHHMLRSCKRWNKSKSGDIILSLIDVKSESSMLNIHLIEAFHSKKQTMVWLGHQGPGVLHQRRKTWGGACFPFSLCSQHVPFKFSMDSHQIPNMFPRFPMCSRRAFPTAPRFNLTCFAQSPPLLTYIGGRKGGALHLFIESSTLGSLHSFNFSLAMGQSNWLIAKKKQKLDL